MVSARKKNGSVPEGTVPENAQPPSSSFLDQRISRRQALSTGAKAGIGVAAVVIVGAAGYLAYTSLSGGTTTATTTTSSTGPTTSSTSSATSTSSLTSSLTSSSTASSTSSLTSSSTTGSATSGNGLVFAHWHFQDAQVTSYIKAFTAEFNTPVTEETLDNNNYNPLIEAKFQTGETLDMNYANGYEVPRLLKLGYVQPAEGMTGIAQIKSEMYPSIVASESTVDGKLYALPYYWSARPCPVVNDDVLNQTSLKGQRPKTWDELWSMAATVQKAGTVQYPVIPNWFNANYGIGWDFMGEMANVNNDPDDTKSLFGKDFAPLFDTNTSAADLLTKWKTAVANNLVDPAVFSMSSESDVVAAGNTGKYAFITTAVYDFQSLNDPKSSKITVGNANLVPVNGQGWGMIETGVYCWPAKNHDPVGSQNLIKFMGYKDPATGKRVTAPTWAEVANLGSGYPDTLQDPAVIAAYQKWLGDRTTATLKIQDDIARNTGTPWIWKSTIYTKWQDTIFPILSAIASGSQDVKSGVAKIRSTADNLWKAEYGSSSTSTTS